MHFLALSLLFTGYMFAVVLSFASYWPVALWVRSSISWPGKAGVLLLPVFIALLLVLSPLARQQSLELGFSFSQLGLAAACIFAGLALLYLLAVLAGALSLRLDRWLLATLPVWLLAVLLMTAAWGLGFYLLAGPSAATL